MASTPVTAAPSVSHTGSRGGLAEVEAVLLLSFGGPEGPEQVMPFLRRVTAGRGVPDERLARVAEHYLQRGGVSPINDANRALLAALGGELRRRGHGLPIAWGNRNAAPFVVDALRELAEAGARRVKVLTTSAYPSYSGCRQYREDLAAARQALREDGVNVELELAEYAWDSDGFVEANASAVAAAIDSLDGAGRRGGEMTDHGAAEAATVTDVRVLFVTHSIPEAMNEASGAAGGGYLSSHLAVAEQVMTRLGSASGRPGVCDGPHHELVFCSRSGPPGQPWLTPDVNDRITELAHEGCRAVVVAPIGFISDHMEVVQDLDTEAAATAADVGLRFARAATAGTHPAFVSALVDALEGTPRRCAVGCCANPRQPDRPAACGMDDAPGPHGPDGAVPGQTR